MEDTENLIRRASMLLLGGVSESDTAAKLMDTGSSAEDAYLAVRGAQVYNDEPPDTQREVQIFEKDECNE